MKNVLILFFALAGFSTAAQTIALNSTDATTGNRLITTSNRKGMELTIADNVARDGALFFAAGYNNSVTKGAAVNNYFIDLTIIHNDNRLGCLQEFTSTAILTLEDGSKIECFQISDSDCDKSSFKAAFALMPKGGKPAEMQTNFAKLLNTPITEIEVVATEGSLTYKIPGKKREILKKHFILIEQAREKPSK